MVQKENLKQGLELLKQPVLPLVSMVEFFLLTGDFATVAEIVEQLPDPIETAYARYDQPAELLKPYLEQLETLLALQQGAEPSWPVITENGEEVDLTTARTALVDQKILTMELEAINSALCGPCGCTLCCVGPDRDMEQAFFEIRCARAKLICLQWRRLKQLLQSNVMPWMNLLSRLRGQISLHVQLQRLSIGKRGGALSCRK